MKLLSDSTFPLIVLLTCVELLDFITARPAITSSGKKHLEMLEKDMRNLMSLVNKEIYRQDMSNNFKDSLTSLPSISYRMKDLDSVKVSSTVAQLSSGLKSFKFHLDWILQKEEVEEKRKSSQMVAKHIQHLINQIGTTPEPVYPSLPPLNTSWNLYQANVEFYDKLRRFCDWYIRALRVLTFR